LAYNLRRKLPVTVLRNERAGETVYIENGLSVTRKTAVSYLAALEKEGFLASEKIGKERIYQNKRLCDLVKYGP